MTRQSYDHPNSREYDPFEVETRIVPSSSQIGALVLHSLQRHSDKLDGTFVEPEMIWLANQGHNNVSVLARSSTDHERQVVCRLPQRDLPEEELNHGLSKEYAALGQLPPGVAPQGYYLDAANPRRPILAQQYLPGMTVPYEEWSEQTFTNLGAVLGRTHSIHQGKVPRVDLNDHLMSPHVPKRIAAIEHGGSTEARLLIQTIHRDAQDFIRGAQPLFNRLRPVSLLHNDLHALNVLVSSDKSRVWLLDWEYSAPGDPDLELSQLYFPNMQFHTIRAHMGPQREQAFLREYERTMGHDQHRLERIRVGQYLEMARMAISLTSMIDTKTQDTFGMSSEELVHHRDRALELKEEILK